jgi:glyoxylase-like metal-dependent hydrolase (beta-lactamase superfamily II)
VILTHSDGDHVDGLPAFPRGVTIIAQETCKTDMQEALRTPRGAGLGDWLPTHTVKDKESMNIDGVRFTLLNFGPAHTSSDLIIYLPDQKIVFVGDLVELKFSYPFIHAEKNGSSEGWIRTMKAVLTLP